MTFGQKSTVQPQGQAKVIWPPVHTRLLHCIATACNVLKILAHQSNEIESKSMGSERDAAVVPCVGCHVHLLAFKWGPKTVQQPLDLRKKTA